MQSILRLSVFTPHYYWAPSILIHISWLHLLIFGKILPSLWKEPLWDTSNKIDQWFSTGSDSGTPLPPPWNSAMSGDILGCHEWRWGATEPGTLLNILQCTGQSPQQRIIRSKLTTVLRLTNPDIGESQVCYILEEFLDMGEKNPNSDLSSWDSTCSACWIIRTVSLLH